MSLAVVGSKTAMGPGLIAYFLGSGGVEPYTYAVLPDGAGGSINSSTGLYASPAALNPNPRFSKDTIQVTDDDGDTATVEVLVTDALGLFCEVIQRELSLPDGRVYLWDQKINVPQDSDLYIAVSELMCKPFANTNRPVSAGSEPEDGLDSVQSVNMLSTLSLDIISRGPAARIRKGEVIMALNSDYAQKQQEANSFYIGKLPAGSQFVNISQVDGAAIPYRYNISVNIQYIVRKLSAISYMDDFSPVTVTTEA